VKVRNTNDYKRSYRGINYDLRFNGFWRVYSEIGDFFGHDLGKVMGEFRAAVNAGPA
jgi:hypothetical protein